MARPEMEIPIDDDVSMPAVWPKPGRPQTIDASELIIKARKLVAEGISIRLASRTVTESCYSDAGFNSPIAAENYVRKFL